MNEEYLKEVAGVLWSGDQIASIGVIIKHLSGRIYADLSDQNVSKNQLKHVLATSAKQCGDSLPNVSQIQEVFCQTHVPSRSHISALYARGTRLLFELMCRRNAESSGIKLKSGTGIGRAKRIIRKLTPWQRILVDYVCEFEDLSTNSWYPRYAAATGLESNNNLRSNWKRTTEKLPPQHKDTFANWYVEICDLMSEYYDDLDIQDLDTADALEIVDMATLPAAAAVSKSLQDRIESAAEFMQVTGDLYFDKNSPLALIQSIAIKHAMLGGLLDAVGDMQSRIHAAPITMVYSSKPLIQIYDTLEDVMAVYSARVRPVHSELLARNDWPVLNKLVSQIDETLLRTRDLFLSELPDSLRAADGHLTSDTRQANADFRSQIAEYSRSNSPRMTGEAGDHLTKSVKGELAGIASEIKVEKTRLAQALRELDSKLSEHLTDTDLLSTLQSIDWPSDVPE